MVLLVDTNIILDVLLSRPEFVKDSSMIWKLCETEQAKGYLSTLTSPAVLERAVAMKWKDFEDAVQSATAESVHADYIVTRNLKDFMKSKVIAFTPAELLARI